jgi:Uma2 family endonuclease
MQKAIAKYLSPAEYLQWEEQEEEKHEYEDGVVYAMAGPSENHISITDNFTALLVPKLRGSQCRSFSSDMRVEIIEKNIYYYPDLLVTCDQRDRLHRNHKNYPCLIIEVLSESTELRDRGVKFAHYQTIESLQEYVLVSQSQQRVEVFRRCDRKLWLLQTFTTGETVQLQSINLEIPIAEIYAGVELGNDSNPE